MKKYIIICCMAVAALVSCKNLDEDCRRENGIKFSGTVESTKVTTSAGVSTWEAGDAVGIYSKAVSNNVKYVTSAGGSVAQFEAESSPVSASTEYFAYYPYSESAGQDYEAVPVTAPALQKFLADGTSTTESPLAGKGLASAAVEGVIPLVFTPVLPILELALTGSATISGIELEVLGDNPCSAASNSFLSGSAAVNLDNQELVCSSLAADANKISVKFVAADGTACNAALNQETPLRLQIVTGRFVVSSGLKLTFTYSNGTTNSKVIWNGKTVNAFAGNVNAHILQPVIVPDAPFMPDMTRPFWIFGDLSGWDNLDTYKMCPMFKDNSNADNYIYTYTGYLPRGGFKVLPEVKLGTYQAYSWVDGTNRFAFDESGLAPAFWNETAGFKTFTMNVSSGEFSLVDFDASSCRVWNTIGFIGTFNGWGTDWDLYKLSDDNNHIWSLDCQVPLGGDGFNCGKFRAEDDWGNIWNNFIGFEWSTPFGKMTTSTQNDVNIYFDAAAADYRVIFNDITCHYILLRK